MSMISTKPISTECDYHSFLSQLVLVPGKYIKPHWKPGKNVLKLKTLPFASFLLKVEVMLHGTLSTARGFDSHYMGQPLTNHLLRQRNVTQKYISLSVSFKTWRALLSSGYI